MSTLNTYIMILNSGMVTVEEVARHLQISHGSIHETIPNRLGFVSVCARCVHKQLTKEHNRKCLAICQHFLNSYQNKSDDFLRHIIMGDKAGIHYYDPNNKCQSMEWKHFPLLIKRKLQVQPTVRRVMVPGIGIHGGQYWNIIKRGAQQLIVFILVKCVAS
jgi:hypothetical protein